MYAVLRNYSGQGAKELLDLLEERKADVERAMRQVPGVRAYSLLRGADGGASLTVCEDKAGADASVKIASEWVRQNAGHLSAKPPTITEGTVILHFG